MNVSKISALIVGLFAVLFLASLASAAQLFLDDFNSGLGAWTPSSGTGAWNIPAGQNYIEAGGVSGNTAATITRNIQTTGFQTLVLMYDRLLSGGFESDNNFSILVSTDGTNFVQVTSIAGAAVPTETSFATQTQSLPISINNNANIQIRFECNTDAISEFCRVDNVKLDGSPISASTGGNLSLTVTGTQPFKVGDTVTLNLGNAGTQSLTATLSDVSSPRFGVTFAPNPVTVPSAGATAQATLTNLQNLKFGTNTVSVRAEAGTQSATANFQVRKTFCVAGESIQSNISIKSIDWSNEGEGDEEEWELLDEIEVEVEVENLDEDDDIDGVVELGLFDNAGNKVTGDLEFIEESEDDEEKVEVNIDEGDEETVTFNFRVPADFDSGAYSLTVKAYDDDAGESSSCRETSSDLDNGFFQKIDVTEASDEGRFVVVDEFNIDSQLVCGQQFSGQFTVFNIGDDDQDRVRVTIFNNELNIREVVELTTDLDQGEEETLSFSTRVPATATNGAKQLEFLTEYDYRNGVYREESEDTFIFPVEVIGCTQNTGGPGGGPDLTNILIDAELDSDARAGEELVITATITNTGAESQTMTINAKDYADWAELADISDASFDLGAGESKQVTFTFDVNEDTAGSQAFDIQVTSAGRTQVQPVEVEFEESDTPSFDLKGNSTLWVIGIINVILIILIIIVAVRLARK